MFSHLRCVLVLVGVLAFTSDVGAQDVRPPYATSAYDGGDREVVIPITTLATMAVAIPVGGWLGYTLDYHVLGCPKYDGPSSGWFSGPFCFRGGGGALVGGGVGVVAGAFLCYRLGGALSGGAPPAQSAWGAPRVGAPTVLRLSF